MTSAPDDRVNPRTHPGPLFSGTVLHGHMELAGFSLLDAFALFERGRGCEAVEWSVAFGPGGPEATRVATMCGRRETERAGMDAFAERLARLRGIDDDLAYADGFDALGARCRSWGGDWQATRDRALADLRRALADVAPALDRLDPVALSLCLDGWDKRGNGLYALLDTRTDPDAPLGVAHAMRPHFDVAMVTLQRVYRRAVRAATRDRDMGALDAILRRSMTVGTGGSARAADLGFRVSDAMDAMRPADLAMVHEGCDERLGGGPGSGFDPPYALGRLLAGLPGDWVSRDGAGWVDCAWCMPAMTHAHRGCGPGTAHLRLHAGGDWAGLRRRLSAAAGLPPSAGPAALAKAIVDVGDMARAFDAQVLGPARVIHGIRSARDGREVAGALLHDGRTLRRSLEMSARWHAAQPVMQAALAALAGAAPASWPAAMPDWSWDGVDLVVLTDAEMLRAEGADAPDADGVPGLRHCVGTYAGSCLSGHSRIVSLRRATAAGTVRISTAQLRFSRNGLALLQHRGYANADPPREAHAALAAYASAIHDGRLAVDEAGLGPVPDGGLASGTAGYDIHGAGNWERVLALWGPHLPRHLRGVGSADMARLFGRPEGAFLSDMQDVMVDLGGRGEHWQPIPFKLPGRESERSSLRGRTSGRTCLAGLR